MSDRRAPHPFWLRSLLCLAASVCFFALLVALAYKIREGGEAIWLDGAIARHVQPHLGPRRTRLALTLTQIGSPAFIVPATFAAALISAFVRRSIWTGIVVTATVGFVGLGSEAMKHVITAAHPRLGAHIPAIPPHAHTFPSTHVACALSLMGIVAIACGGKPRHRIIWLGIAAVTAIVAATRIYLGAHWFSDTVGGVFLGLSAVFAGAALLPHRKGPRPTVRLNRQKLPQTSP